MNLSYLAPAWFDVLAFGVLVFGLFRGKKRGMSAELLDVLKWLMVVVVAALYYRPLGQLLSAVTRIGPLPGNLVAYSLIGIGINMGFTALKRAVGEKLVGSDVFGRWEFHLGMFAGMLRYGCILLAAMSLMHARLYTPAEVAAQFQRQEAALGSNFFPTFGKLQHDVLYRSVVGGFVKEHLEEQLIHAVPYRASRREGIGREREKAVEDAMGFAPRRPAAK
jgi:uncharacterized membrane protein required for colicin V production